MNGDAAILAFFPGDVIDRVRVVPARWAYSRSVARVFSDRCIDPLLDLFDAESRTLLHRWVRQVLHFLSLFHREFFYFTFTGFAVRAALVWDERGPTAGYERKVLTYLRAA
jgi:hypothetical protein